MAELLAPAALIALFTLTILEIVLGIDNLVFLAIITGKLPEEQQRKARNIGLALAAVGRILLLFGITWLIQLDDKVLFELPFDTPGQHAEDAAHMSQEALDAHLAYHAGHESAIETANASGASVDLTFMDHDHAALAGEAGHADAAGEGLEKHGTPITPKDLILLLGGLFLVGKATWEIGHAMEPHDDSMKSKVVTTFSSAMVQLFLVNLVFSIDSVLTAIGMVPPSEYEAQWVPLTIMISAVLISIAIMLIFAKPVTNFVNRHPSVKMLALAFLILIGVVLIAESLHTHIPRGYIYFSMGFALFVEMLNLRASSRGQAATDPDGGEH